MEKKLIIGKKAILDAIDNKTLISAIISNKDKTFHHKVSSYTKDLKINNDSKYYQNLTNVDNHQFAIGYVLTDNDYQDLKSYLLANKKEKSLIVIVDEIEDPHNFGSIIRTCEALGVDAIIYKKDNQVPINETVVKVSAGAIANVNCICVTNINESIKKLKDFGYWIYASVLDKDSHNINKVKFTDKVALVVGNEKSGVSSLVVKNSDFTVHIPMEGKTQSLNVAVATGILLYKIKN